MEVVGTDFLIFDGGFFGEHSHEDQFEFHYLLSPIGKFTNGGKVTRVDRNCLVFSRPLEKHSFYSDFLRSQPIFFLRFRPENSQEKMLLQEASKKMGSKPKYVPHLADSFRQIRHFAHAKGDHAMEAAASGLKMILHAAAAGTFGTELESEAPAVQDAIDLIDSSLEKELDFKTVVKRSGQSGPAFARLFKKKTGHTVLGYLRIRRLETARFYLETTQNPIHYIAQKLQFCDEFHFSKTFKHWCGFSPRDYRNALSK
jgi:AraC-like DNA-binding protein